MNYSGYCYKLDNEWLANELYHIRNDSDVIILIGRILTENKRVLHIYVDHKTDVADLTDPTEQPADASELCLLDGGGVQDADVDKGDGEEEQVGDESSDQYNDSDYEATREENLSGYETTDAVDEDLYTTVARGKNKEDFHGKFDWIRVGASFNAHVGDVVSFDSADSERDMESLSSEFDDVMPLSLGARRR
jgi:hypothetical protein